MPLLTKCNVTNMTFPSDCISDEERTRVFVSILIPSRHPRNHPTFKRNVKCLITGKETVRYEPYPSRCTALIDYAPAGIFFSGNISEYGEITLDFTDERTIYNLGLLVYSTQFQIENVYNSRVHYYPDQALEMYKNSQYSDCWNMISECLRFFHEENVLIQATYGPVPIAMSLIRGDAFDKMMSPEHQKEVFSNHWYSRDESVKQLTLADRMDLAKKIVSCAKETCREHDTVANHLARIIEEPSYHLPDHLNVFGCNIKEVKDRSILGNVLMVNFLNDNLSELTELVEQMIQTEYLISCFEGLEIEFRRANTVSNEDYVNYSTYQSFKFIQPLIEQDQLEYDNDEGYPCLINGIAGFANLENRYWATYFDVDKNVEKMIAMFGEYGDHIDEEDCDCNSVLVFDRKDQKYFIIEDHELMTSNEYKLVGELSDDQV